MLGRRAERTRGRNLPARNKKAALLVLAVFLFAFLAALAPTGAIAASTKAAKQVGLQYLTATGLTTVDIRIYVGRIIRYFLGLLGTLAVLLFLYAGYLYMTSYGDAEKIDKAKKIMVDAVIGLVIIVSAYAIASWILGALTGTGLGGTGAGSAPPKSFILYSGNRGTALGNGIIEYHYPEPGQTEVPRNTKISITFKKPLVLSTVFKNYDDKNTYDPGDDELCPSKPPCSGGVKVTASTKLELNSDNVKIIPNDSLGNAGAGSFDDQFNSRYPDAGALTAPSPSAKATPAAMPFKAPQEQTIVMKPVSPIGSPTADVNYRVALRGGESGIKVWDETNDPAKPAQAIAFADMTADGSYFWSFTTNTTIDTTPPQIVAVIPETTPVPGSPADTILDRNQLLQIYFSEAVDPTTASGVIGAGGGFNNVDIQAKCLPGAYAAKTCDFNKGDPGSVDGTLSLGNRYRTAEFVPSSPCEGITENSCGEAVYCLPKNVTLTVIAKAATLDFATKNPEPPAAAVDNGVEDMVGNSMDGNNDGAAQGPQGTPAGAEPGGRPQTYYRNVPQSPLDAVSDTARWDYQVGSNVDLTVPVIIEIDPPAGPPPSGLYKSGPSNVPVATPVTMTWSKTMSVASMRSGSYDEDKADYADPYSTLVFRSYECQKLSTAACKPGSCPCSRLDPPGFYIGGLMSDTPPQSMLVPDPKGGGKVTRLAFLHPVVPFFTANDLGYTESDINASPLNIPSYVPIARAKIKDAKQNCFWPSRYSPTGSDCVLASGQTSCCNKTGLKDAKFTGQCAPQTP